MSEQKKTRYQPIRDPKGRWQKGQTGNPYGRPSNYKEVVRLARCFTTEAVNKLVQIMNKGKSDDVQMRAAIAILDRGWGKAPQIVQIEDDNNSQTEAAFKEKRERVAGMLDGLASRIRAAKDNPELN